jgi:hypothetical protein
MDGDTAHLLEIQAIPWTQARLKSRRGRFIREGPLHVGDEAVIVGVEAEGSERLNQAIKIGDDHHQRPDRAWHKKNATCATHLTLHADVNSNQMLGETKAP